MSNIIRMDELQDVIYKGKSSDSMYYDSKTLYKKQTSTTLVDGPTFNAALEKTATTFTRSTTAPDASITTTDISKDNDGSIVTWYDTTSTTQYWYSNAYKVYMNENSSGMFRNCTSLTSLDVSHFDTSKVTNMSNMFNSCTKITSLDVSNFDTSSVTNTSSMFVSCYHLTSLDLSHFNTWNVIDMGAMFNSCYQIVSLNLSGFDTSKINHLMYFFKDCSALTNIIYGDKFILSDTLYVKCTDTIDTNLLKNMYLNCPANKPTGGNWDMGTWNDTGTFIKSEEVVETTEAYLTTGQSFNTSINALNITQFIRSSTPPSADTTDVIDVSRDSDNSIVTWYDESNTTQYWYSNANKVYLNEDSYSMFYGCSELTSLDLSAFLLRTDIPTYIGWMFEGCNNLTSLNLSSFDTSTTADMQGMFSGCSSLTSLDVSNFNTSNVTDMKYMFNGCSLLSTITFGSNFVNTSLAKLTLSTTSNGSYNMYNGCSANKPTWTGGTWNANGTFIASA